MKGTIIFFLALVATGIYYGFQPAEKVLLKGVKADVDAEQYQLFVRSEGSTSTAEHDVSVYTEPPYRLDLRILLKDEEVEYVEVQDVFVYACGAHDRLLTSGEQLVYTVDYFDYKKPIALYKLKGEVDCHSNVIMDISFVLRDMQKNEKGVFKERVLVESYEYTPSYWGYWWSNARLW